MLHADSVRGVSKFTIIMNTFHVSKTLIMIQETAGHDTSPNLALPAGGIRRPHPRLIIWGLGCGNAWSLYVIAPQTPTAEYFMLTNHSNYKIITAKGGDFL